MIWFLGCSILYLATSVQGCFCPSCGCGNSYGGSYGSYSAQYAQPQGPYAPTVVWYPRPIPVGNPFPATGYASPPQPPRPVYYPPQQIPQYRVPQPPLQSVLVPRPRVETVYGGANAIPPVEDIPIKPYRPDPVRTVRPVPTEVEETEEIVREIEVVTSAPRPVQNIQTVHTLRPRPVWTTTARTTTTTEEIVFEEEETEPVPVRTTTRAHFEVPTLRTEPVVVTTTTEGPEVEGTTRLVHIPRKKGDGKSNDYEYYYVYYDEKNGTTTKTDQVIELDKKKSEETATEETGATDYDFDSGTETEKPTEAVVSGKGDVKESDKYEKTRGAVGGKQEIETVDEAPVNGNKIGENEEFVYYEVDDDKASTTAPLKQVQVEGGSLKTEFSEYQDETTIVEGQQPDNKEKEGDSSTELQYPRKAEIYDYKHKRENKRINDGMVVRRKLQRKKLL